MTEATLGFIIYVLVSSFPMATFLLFVAEVLHVLPGETKRVVSVSLLLSGRSH
jgi:hypothetical protein